MQTFLPYADYTKSAKSLDNKRLGKQRVECLQILQTLTNPTTAKSWKNHPVVKMWKGYENALVEYGLAICLEWRRRGFKDTCYEKIYAYLQPGKLNMPPPFIGNLNFHLSHQSNLLRKNPIHYTPIFGTILKHFLDYVWPR